MRDRRKTKVKTRSPGAVVRFCSSSDEILGSPWYPVPPRAPRAPLDNFGPQHPPWNIRGWEDSSDRGILDVGSNG